MKKVAKCSHRQQHRHWIAALLSGLFALLAAGCGASRQHASSTAPAISIGARAAPSDWHVARIPSGAELYYPPRWRAVPSDPGSASAALLGSGRRLVVLGYLNLTPRQGGETPANWPDFRLAHDRQERDRDLTREAVARGVRFRTGTGTCVRDSYTTFSHARFIELACIVQGARATSVIVGAAPPLQWPRISPLLFRALSALTT